MFKLFTILENAIFLFLILFIAVYGLILFYVTFKIPYESPTKESVTYSPIMCLKDLKQEKEKEVFVNRVGEYTTYNNPYRKNGVKGIKMAEISVPVLMYHHIGNAPQNASSKTYQYYIPVEEFEKQMRYLYLADYNVVTIDQLIGALEGKITLPERSVVITFDDLPPDQITNGLPILKKYGFKATFFMNVNRAYNDDKYVNALLNDGHAVGSHSYNHLDLTKIRDKNKLKFEIYESKKVLEERYKVPFKYFAYPGCKYTSEIEIMVKEAGYEAAFSCAIPHNKKSIKDIYRLGRRLITSDFDAFIARLEDREGIW
uniref:NodB homology domain-containing protein n=1 Tax=candidate division CPR3 bacterium TaxID=2268181 RepID=A0A7C5YRF8_UNCC3